MIKTIFGFLALGFAALSISLLIDLHQAEKQVGDLTQRNEKLQQENEQAKTELEQERLAQKEVVIAQTEIQQAVEPVRVVIRKNPTAKDAAPAVLQDAVQMLRGE